MTPVLSRTAFWWDPAPTDTSDCVTTLDFHVDQGTCQGLEKTTVYNWWRKVAPLGQGMSLDCFCLFMRQRGAFRKQNWGLCMQHVQPFCMRGFGTWSWAAFQSLTKHQVHQRSQGWLLLWECWAVLSTDKSQGLTGTQLTPSSTGAVRYRHASRQILTKRKKERKEAEWVHVDSISFLNTANSQCANPWVCELSGLPWGAAEWKGTESPFHGSFLPTSAHLNVTKWSHSLFCTAPQR